MWIRSQDKKNLANGEIIYFLGDCLTVRCGKVGTNDEYDLILATYSTKEKALKVLDMIQKEVSLTNDNSVYVMPQDDEVE